MKGFRSWLQVARLLAELRMDKESLIAGLLHDTVEDNPAQITFEEIGVCFHPCRAHPQTQCAVKQW